MKRASFSGENPNKIVDKEGGFEPGATHKKWQIHRKVSSSKQRRETGQHRNVLGNTMKLCKYKYDANKS